jgi:hypothetical protein
VKSITTLAPVRSVARPLTARADPADAAAGSDLSAHTGLSDLAERAGSADGSARSEDEDEILLLLAETRLSAAGPGPAAVRTRERRGRMLK